MTQKSKKRVLWAAVFFTAILAAITCIFYDYKIAAALLPILALLLYYLLSAKEGRPLPSIIEPTVSFNKALWKEIANKTSSAIALTGANDRIIWENMAFTNKIQKPGQRISHVVDILSADVLETLEKEPAEVDIGSERFLVKKVKIQANNKKPEKMLQIYYFDDITQIYNLKLQLREKETVVCYVYVDNFDEVMVACGEENRLELLAEIDKTITKWVYNYNGLVRKYDNDKYLVLMSLKDFKKAEEAKLNILDAIREIKAGKTMTPTLSIGAAYGEPSLTKAGKIAQNALELCLGRGGDQAVVKAEGKTYFYGGKTEEMNKYSRVRVRVIAHALGDLVEESDSVMIIGHLFLDMDALGAAAGLANAVKSMNKPGYIILTPEQTSSVDSLLELLLTDEEIKGSFIEESEALNKITKKTLLIVVDTHKPSLVMSQKILEKAERVVVIDHHRRGEEFIDKALLVYLEPYASSTSEIVTEIIQYMGDDIKISPIVATAMLAGIAVDTRNFAFKTGARTFEAASYLRRAGADPTMVYKLFQEDADAVYERAKVLQRAQQVAEHVVISYFDEEPKNPTVAAAQAANGLIGLKGISASFVLAPMGERITISARSLGDINVHRILEELGGGGHMTVAGAQLSNVTMEEAIEKVKEAILKHLKEGETN
ncbi:DHH family phosphoesterase [Tepidanaerobacter syntrophicus]|uniref:Cyclic-di-AMP phosphodiesterase n=1 Tax=Tepidanaerobacter syntrophicus TaxID=224999 RepID=A0A0U9HDJ3_9FIRM|nr:DHH family phosphoesterase [Tepidanaerobacter syntrophicus]GAQ24889.1 c-di-AMP phosphodiesterase [Tepidanaerobacter syntrophicus]